MPSTESSASLARWAQRYQLPAQDEVVESTLSGVSLTLRAAQDTWSTAPVDWNSAANRDHSAFSEQQRQRFIELAGILRHNDHAHIQPVTDFYLENDQCWHWVVPAAPEASLEEQIDRGIRSEAAVELIAQFVSVISYFAQHSPNMVPDIASDGLRLLPDGKLYIAAFQGDYFFGPSLPTFPALAEFIFQVCRGADSDATADQLAEIACELKAENGSLTTLSKVKNAIKHLQEAQS